MVVPRLTGLIIETPDRFKSQEMCNESVGINPLSLPYVLNRFKTLEMCDAAVREDPSKLEFVPDPLKTQRVCNEAATNNPYILRYILDWLSQEMSDTAIRINPTAFFSYS